MIVRTSQRFKHPSPELMPMISILAHLPRMKDSFSVWCALGQNVRGTCLGLNCSSSEPMNLISI